VRRAARARTHRRTASLLPPPVLLFGSPDTALNATPSAYTVARVVTQENERARMKGTTGVRWYAANTRCDGGGD